MNINQHRTYISMDISYAIETTGQVHGIKLSTVKSAIIACFSIKPACRLFINVSPAANALTRLISLIIDNHGLWVRELIARRLMFVYV